MSNGSKVNNDESFYMDSVERIKLIGAISDCDTQTLLNAYIDILGIESLRPFLLTTFFKSIPITSSINRNTVISPPLPQKLLDIKNHIHDKAQNGTIKTTVNNLNKSSKKKHSHPKHKNGRNFASTNGHNKLELHSTNQPLPSRTTPAQHHCTPLTTNPQLSSHNNYYDINTVVPALNRCTINKYFNIDEYPQDLNVFNGELPDDIYMKIFSWLDFKTVLISLKLVSRSWFHLSSQSSSIGHFKCLLPLTHNIEWHTFQFISSFQMYWNGDKTLDRWSDYNRVLTECCKANMRDIKQLMIKFHDFSFYSFSKHPLKRLFKLQRNLCKIELNAMIHWKEHDIADCLRFILDSDVINTLKSFIVHNFIINPTKEELIEYEDDNDLVILSSAKVLAQFLIECKTLSVFRWYYDHIHREYTCYALYIAFHIIYFKSLIGFGSITDLHLPSFPYSFREKERMLYHGVVNRLRLNRLHFVGDLSIIDWKAIDLEYLELNPSRSTNESFTECFTSINNLKYLSINTIGLATTGYYQNDELTNFVTPYFRTKNLNKLRFIDINVKFLEEKSLFAFLLKCKYAISLKSLSINGQSFNGTLKNEDIRKYIGEFVGDQQFEFSLSIISQFYSSKSQLNVVRLSNNKGINIDKDEWKKKKKLEIKKDSIHDQQSLSMKLADIEKNDRPRFQ